MEMVRHPSVSRSLKKLKTRINAHFIGKVPKEEEEQGDGQFIQVKEENVGEDSAHEVEDPHFVGIKQELLWNEDEYEDAVNFGELGLETNTVKMEESLLEEHPITDAESEAELNHEETPVSDQCINLVQLNINYSTIPTILNIETDTVSGESLPNPDNRYSLIISLFHGVFGRLRLV